MTVAVRHWRWLQLSWLSKVSPEHFGMRGRQPRPEHFPGLPIDSRRGDRPGMHIQPNARTLTKHRGLLTHVGKAKHGNALDNPRGFVSEVPASNYSGRAVTTYGLSGHLPDPASSWFFASEPAAPPAVASVPASDTGSGAFTTPCRPARGAARSSVLRTAGNKAPTARKRRHRCRAAQGTSMPDQGAPFTVDS